MNIADLIGRQASNFESHAEGPRPNGVGTPLPSSGEGAIIFELIRDQQWEQVKQLCQDDPVVANVIDPVSGRSPLHMVCAIGSCTSHVIAAVVAAAPHMMRVHDKVYHDTPLHIVCRNVQRTLAKIEVLLPFASKEDVLKRNVIGGTCLHSACGHNAMFPVLQLLVQKNPAILKISTYDAIPPIRGLFFSYTQSIPGVLAVGKLLKGREVTEGHFERFRQKAYYLALEYFKLTNACPMDAIGEDGSISNNFVAHGMLHSNAPLNLLKITLKRDPHTARARDRDGNTILHQMVERRPYRLKECEALKAVLETFPEAATFPNAEGRTPLLLAICNKIPFENGVGDILRADMTIVAARDAETQLLPFQLAAAVGGPEALNTTFQLLSALPEVIGS